MEIWIVVVQKVAMAGGVVLGCGVKGVGGEEGWGGGGETVGGV